MGRSGQKIHWLESCNAQTGPRSNRKFSHPICPLRWWVFTGLTQRAMQVCNFWRCRLCPQLGDIKTEKTCPQKMPSICLPHLRPGLHWGCSAAEELLEDPSCLGAACTAGAFGHCSSHGHCLCLPVLHCGSVFFFQVPQCVQVEPQFFVVLVDLLGSHLVVCRSLAWVWIQTHTFCRGVLKILKVKPCKGISSWHREADFAGQESSRSEPLRGRHVLQRGPVQMDKVKPCFKKNNEVPRARLLLNLVRNQHMESRGQRFAGTQMAAKAR